VKIVTLEQKGAETKKAPTTEVMRALVLGLLKKRAFNNSYSDPDLPDLPLAILYPIAIDFDDNKTWSVPYFYCYYSMLVRPDPNVPCRPQCAVDPAFNG